MASTLNYIPKSSQPLTIGHKYDHKDKVIKFKFEKQVKDSVVYFKLQTNNNNWMIPLVNMEWLVTQPMTNEAGEFRGQLMEAYVDADGNAQYINSSDTFKVTVQKSIKEGSHEIVDPSLDLWAQHLEELYSQIKEAFERGDFKGKDGYTPVKGKDYFDGYTPVKGVDYFTEEDKEEIASKVHVEEKTIINNIENPYDDSEIKKEISQQFESIVEISDNLDKLEKNTTIITNDGEGYTHSVENPISVDVYGNEYAFGNVNLFNEKNMIESLPQLTYESKGVKYDFVDDFIIMNGESSGGNTGSVNSTREIKFVDFEKNTKYTMIIVNNKPTPSQNPVLFLYARYEGESSGYDHRIVYKYLNTNKTETKVEFTTPNEKITKIAVKLDQNGAGANYDNFIIHISIYKSGYEKIDTDFSVNNGEIIKYDISNYNWDVVDTGMYRSKVTYNPSVQKFIEKISGNIDAPTTYITPEQFGAKGDGISDDSNAFELCINYAKEKQTMIIGAGNYKILKPLKIHSTRLKVIINKILYIGDDCAVEICGNNNDVNILYINTEKNQGNPVGVRVLADKTISNATTYNNIVVSMIYSYGNSIEFVPKENTGVATYNTVHFNYLSSSYGDGIYCGYTYGENAVYGKSIAAYRGWAINLDGQGSTGFNFYDISLETTVKNGIRINNSNNNTFNNFRWRELIDKKRKTEDEGTLVKFIGYTHSNVINGKDILWLDTIDTSEQYDYSYAINDNTQVGYLNKKYILGSNIIRTTGVGFNNAYGNACYDLIIRAKHKILKPYNKKSYKQYFSDEDLRIEELSIDFPTVFDIKENVVIRLHESYCSEGYNDIMILQNDGKWAKIYDNKNVLIFDGESKESGKYRLEFVCDIYSMVQNLGSSFGNLGGENDFVIITKTL